MKPEANTPIVAEIIDVFHVAFCDPSAAAIFCDKIIMFSDDFLISGIITFSSPLNP
jgi:hypothetical protein